MKKVIEPSIQRLLLVSLMVPLLILWGFTVTISTIRAFEFATRTYDHELANSAGSVAGRLNYATGKLTIDIPESMMRLILHSSNEKFFYTVFDDAGKVLAGDSGMSFIVGETDEPVFADGTIGTEPVRINRITVDSKDFPHGSVYVQVAETLHHRRDYALQLLVNMVVPDLLLIVLVFFAVYFGVARGLQPLLKLASGIGARSELDLSPIDEQTIPKEVRPLIHAINQLLARVADDMESQKRFLANAAHQFRTPVAGLKTYVGYAKRLVTEGEVEKVLNQIDSGADRLTHLTNRLLNLAKFDAERRLTESMAPLDLNEIAVIGTTEVSPLALQKNIELAFEPSENRAVISGNAQALAELVMNLVENAVLYTQVGGEVNVRVNAADPTEIILTVEDNGPGIAESERDRVFERFYRVLGSDAIGSGLGLSIVKEIADIHNAKIEVSSGENGIGTRFTVTFQPSTNSMGQSTGATV